MNFVCIYQKFQDYVLKHGLCFDCVAISTQFLLEHGDLILFFYYKDTLMNQIKTPFPTHGLNLIIDKEQI